ncbi:MAG: hypothetical protein IJW96_02805 [Clostridia bacterium]|nr:hypothetical protein [Clostridia bacterium]
MNWLDILLSSLLAVIVWGIFLFIILLYIYSQIREKNREKYAFFSNCWLKKMFLVGLNERMKKSMVVFTFLINVSLCLLLLLGIWWSISPTSVIAQYGYRVTYGMYGVCFMARLLLLIKYF